MFDREFAATSVESLSAFQRGQVATACLVRVAALLDDRRVAVEFSTAARLVRQIRDAAVARAEGGPDRTDLSALDRQVRDFLGPDDDPFEELPGWGAWAMDITSLADYVLRTWQRPEESAKNCFNVFLATYSIAGYLEDDSESDDVPELADAEFRRQMDDISVLGGGGAWDGICQDSLTLAQSYLQWFQHIEA
ncbi:hypothetical protein ACFVYD_12380 [Streptomyces sp. NPDC058301]|uniref:hypothetical protein n=1 Tax=Streptomyces sp. NPDC058301 TaxID=3346436 RepID=UPI0036E55F17